MKELKKVKIGIIGCGAISKIYMVNLTNLFSITELIAVADLKREAAEAAAKQFGIEKVLSVEEMLNDPEVEMVINLTGPAAHYSVIKQCLEAGKHVYTEKMLCFDIDEGRELIDMAEKKGLYLGVSPDTFLGAGLQSARKYLDAGLIGQVTSAVACINRNQLLNSELFPFIRSTGGGMPYDVGIYYLTALLALLGPVTHVTGFSKKPETYQGQLFCYGNYGKEWTFSSSNSMALSLRFENGVLGSLHFDGTSINEEQPCIAIYGTEGILCLGDPNTFGGYVKLVNNTGKNCDLPLTHGYTGSPLYGNPTNGEIALYGHRGLGAAEMAWAIRNNRKNRASKEMGFHAVEILCGAELAEKDGIIYQMKSRFEKPAPLPSGYMSVGFGGNVRLDAEASLMY